MRPSVCWRWRAVYGTAFCSVWAMAQRHVRLLAPLAFVSPRIVSALLDGTAPADLTLTTLARALPDSWAEQERRLARDGVALALILAN